MGKKNITKAILVFVLLATLGVQFTTPVKAASPLEIWSDFTFTENLYESIAVIADNITIDGNGYTLQGPGVTDIGFLLDGRNNVTIKNVVVKGWREGILLLYSSNNSIFGNNITTNRDHGIRLYSSSNNSLYENTLSNIGSYGIRLRDSSSNSIYGNYITENYRAIGLEGSSSNKIFDNNITDNDDYGISTHESSNNTISGNYLKANNRYGIYVSDSSSYNDIYRNDITENFRGIWLTVSSNFNSIYGNNISNNEYCGIGFWPYPNSLENMIYHNNFIDNGLQALDENPEDNYWHHLGLEEGNYWSDYPGDDDGSGTGKHAIAGDGIGDTEIPWPGPDYDNYPLMDPWAPIPPVVAATIDIDPDTLNLVGNGKWVTTYIELPENYYPDEVDITSIRLEDFLPVESAAPMEIGDYDEDGIPDLMVKFDRAVVQAYLSGSATMEYDDENGRCYEVTILITGSFFDETLFEGTDTIKIRSK